MDLGNAADLLQLLAFTQMKLSSDILNSTGRILSGFNGATTTTLGDVTLPVKVGPVTKWVLFSIVKDLGPYNAIMGWTSIFFQPGKEAKDFCFARISRIGPRLSGPRPGWDI